MAALVKLIYIRKLQGMMTKIQAPGQEIKICRDQLLLLEPKGGIIRLIYCLKWMTHNKIKALKISNQTLINCNKMKQIDQGNKNLNPTFIN